MRRVFIAERSPTSLRPVAMRLQPVAGVLHIGRWLVPNGSKLVAGLSPILRRAVAETLPIHRQLHAEIIANCAAIDQL